MNILGIGGSSHDFSACLMVDGRIRYMVEDERITRIKHSLALSPLQAARCSAAHYCLKQADLAKEDLDIVVTNDIVKPFYYTGFRKQITIMNHHLAHACSAFYTSPFHEAAILVADGMGSHIDGSSSYRETITSYRGDSSKVTELEKQSGKTSRLDGKIINENSIGRWYTIVTRALGFGKMEEGKTMGLAAYGTPRYINLFSQFYRLGRNGLFIHSLDDTRNMLLFLQQELKEASSMNATEICQADLAYAVQYHTERIVLHLCNHLYHKTQSKNLCLSGGVFLNSVVNFKTLCDTPFEHVYVQPAAGDAGTAIGSCYYAYHMMMGYKREYRSQLFSPFLGKEYLPEEIAEALERHSSKLVVTKPDNLYKVTARLLREGNIIGWYQGRSEIGPRALGNRSILADASYPDMKERINSRIKHREAFRPFAPIVLREKQLEYFESDYPSYYMLFVDAIRSKRRTEIPSVTHIDGTGRVQSVTEELTPILHELMTEFYQQSGIPVLLNTSFNDNGEPIVETPLDAINCFLRIDLDYLVIGDHIVKKRSEA